MSLDDHRIRKLAYENGYTASKTKDQHLWTLVHTQTGHYISGLTSLEARGILVGTRSMSAGQGFRNPV